MKPTHLTGIVTVLGVMKARALKHKELKAWKIGFLSSILLWFFAGGLTGFLTFGKVGYYSICIRASMCLIGAIGFYFLRERKNPG